MARSTSVMTPGSGRIAIPRMLVGALVLVVIIAILGVTGVLAQARQLIPGLSEPAPTYQTTAVGKGNIEVSVIATGPVAAINDVPLTFKTSGKLAKLNVAVGDQVKKGQVLAVLDPTDLQTALDQAKANLAQAQASLDKAQAGPTSDEKAVAKTSVDSATTAAANAVASVATTKKSVANDITASQAGVHTAQLSLAAAQDGVTSAQDQEKRGIAADQTAVTNAQKSLAEAKAAAVADVPILQQNLEKAKDSLWSTQISRDATCGRSNGTDCQSANAGVAGAETSVNTTAAQIEQTKQQDQQKIEQAQATLDQSNAQLADDKAKLAAAIVTAQNQVKQAQASLASAQNGVAQAQAKATATVQTSQAQVDQANNALKSAQANYNQALAPPDPSDVATAKAQVVNAQAALETAQANFDAANLTAPFDATVAAVSGTVGQYVAGGAVASGDTALFTLVDLTNLQVTAQVNEADIGKVKVGDPVTYSVSAFPDKAFAGKVLNIQPTGTVVQNVVNYNVTCSIQSAKDAALYPGMTAAATIVAEKHDNITMVPNAALSFAQTAFRDGLVKANAGPTRTAAGSGQQAGQNAGRTRTAGSANAGTGASARRAASANRGAVLTLKNGQLVPTIVTLGISDGTNTEILSGVTGGETIVVGQSGVSTSSSSTSSSGRGGGRPGGGAFFVGRGG